MLLGVAILYGIFVPAGTYPTLRGDALSALFYFANWHYIASGSDYFHMTGLTSPLIHTWSLAVEEQFYLVWPLVFLGRPKARGSLRALLVVAVVGVIASALEMALLYNPTDINRLYFGTDTHAQSVSGRGHSGPRPGACGPSATERGRTGLAGPHAVGPRRADRDRRRRPRRQQPALHQCALRMMPSPIAGDSFIAALAACAVLLSVSCAQFSPVARLLSFGPFTFIGRISYGMYLWHFPLFIFINEQRTGLSPWPLFVVRVIPTIGVAILSFFLVERPIRQGTFFTRFRAQVFTLPAVGVVVLAIVLATMPAADTIAVGAAAVGTVPATAVSGPIPATYSSDADPGPPGRRLPGPDARHRPGGRPESAPEDVRRPASPQ